MRVIIWLLIISMPLAYGGEFIGSEFPPYPEGYESKTGACIGYSLGRERACDYSVFELRRETPQLILAARKVGMVGKKAKWSVTDQIKYPVIGEGQLLVLGVCRANGRIDHSISAVVNDSGDEWLKAENWAIKVDLKSGKIKLISAAGVECENEGWGV